MAVATIRGNGVTMDRLKFILEEAKMGFTIKGKHIRMIAGDKKKDLNFKAVLTADGNIDILKSGGTRGKLTVKKWQALVFKPFKVVESHVEPPVELTLA